MWLNGVKKDVLQKITVFCHLIWGTVLANKCGKWADPAGNAGVGPVTAARLVQHYGDSVMEVLDGKGAAAALARVSGIGATQASRIKLAWDASRGALLGLLKCLCREAACCAHRPATTVLWQLTLEACVSCLYY